MAAGVPAKRYASRHVRRNVGANSRNPFAKPAPAGRGLGSLASRAAQARLSVPPGFQPRPAGQIGVFGGNKLLGPTIVPPPAKLTLPDPSKRPKTQIRSSKKSDSGNKVDMVSELRAREEEDGASRKKKRAASETVEDSSSSAGVRDFPDGSL